MSEPMKQAPAAEPHGTHTTPPPSERRCTATNRAGGRCQKYAIRGGTVCPTHGGNAPQVRRRAQANEALRKATADANAALAHHGLQPVADPIVELSKAAREIVALKDALAARVNALQASTYSVLGAEKVRAEVELYERALDRTVRVLDLLGRHDLEERRVVVQEDTARLFELILNGVLADLHLSAEQSAMVEPVVAEWVQKSVQGVSVHDLPSAR